MAADNSKVTIKTTLPAKPLPPFSERTSFRTARLLLEPISQGDLAAFHTIRTQPESTAMLGGGRIDKDHAETQTWLNRFLPPNDAGTYVFALKLPSSGEVIGMGGVVRMNTGSGWPEVGYGISYLHWNKGYATEFVRGFLEHWWLLPRAEVEASFDGRYVQGIDKSEPRVAEHVMAIAGLHNPQSCRVLVKSGFEQFGTWESEVRSAKDDSAAAPQLETDAGFHLRRPSP